MCKDFCKNPCRCPSGCSLEKKQVPHKHAELIKAWADGAKIQVYLNVNGEGVCDWVEENPPRFDSWATYRIRPESKPDVVVYSHISGNGPDCLAEIKVTSSRKWEGGNGGLHPMKCNAKMVFDGETGALKSVEKI